jgi:hypothetical protein
VVAGVGADAVVTLVPTAAVKDVVLAVWNIADSLLPLYRLITHRETAHRKESS